MSGVEGQAPASDDDRALAAYAEALADGVSAALPAWVERHVLRLATAWGTVPDAEARIRIVEAGVAAQREVGAAVAHLLRTDIDAQRTSPLALVRDAVRFPTEVLASLGVPPVVRDAEAERQFPADLYDLTPASFAELHDSLREPALVWGAAKAHVHLQRRRAERR